MLAAAHRTLRECEREGLTQRAREYLREALYGSDTTYNFGKVKLEFASDTLTCMGPKCYFATNNDDVGGPYVSSVKMKGCQSRKQLGLRELTALGERRALLRERAPRIRRSAFGVRHGQMDKLSRADASSLSCRPTWSRRRRSWPRSGRWRSSATS